MENISVQHRLLGKEDLYLDTANTDETSTFTSPLGTELVSTAINAKHIPLSAEANVAIGKNNVSDALIYLDGKIDSIATSSTEGATTDLSFEKTSLTSADIDGIMSAISTATGGTGKLNGHKVTLKLVGSSSSISAAKKVEFRSLYDGRIVVDLNGKSISNSLTTDAGVVGFEGCQCVCEVKNGTVSHTSQKYGIVFHNSCTAIASGVTFATGSASGHYGISAIGCPLSVSSCVFDGGKVYIGEYSGDTYEVDGNAFAMNDVDATVDEMEEVVSDLEDKLDGYEDYIVESGADTTNGIFWSLYKGGRLEIWGTTALSTYNNGQKWVHLVDFGDVVGHEYADTNYTIVLSPIQDNNTAITLDETTGAVTGVTITSTSTSYVSVASNATTESKFYIVAKYNPQALSGYNGKVSWRTIGSVSSEG